MCYFNSEVLTVPDLGFLLTFFVQVGEGERDQFGSEIKIYLVKEVQLTVENLGPVYEASGYISFQIP